MYDNWRVCGSAEDVWFWERHFPEMAATLDALHELGMSKPSNDKFVHIGVMLTNGVEAGLIGNNEKYAIKEALGSRYGWM